MSEEPWLPLRGRRPPGGLPLLCLPYAGAGAAAFREWSEELPSSIEPLAVESPGRGTRIGDIPFRRVHDLAAAAAEALAPLCRGPYAMFGHSLGAFVAFEMSRILLHSGTPPIHLFVSASRAPHLPPTADPAHRLPGSALRERLRSWGGIPEQVFAEPDLFAILEPGLRADLEASETYQNTTVEDMGVPITAFVGLTDPLALPHEVAQWSLHTSAYFALRTLPGNHFFVRDSRALLLGMILRELELVGLHSPRGTTA
jgi:surfactin synthase thioesterase subunit